MMLHSSTQELIRKLCELTEAGTITWKEGEDGSSIFETEGYLVEIAAEPPGVRLLRADGRELERADAADLAAPWHDGEGTFASHVADMSRRAERIARGAESAIAKILSSLSSPPKKPVEPEPESAALAFDATPIVKSTHSVSAGESAAAFAAVSADLESQRRKAAEEPPVSHSAPEPDPAPVIAIPPETETAIDRVLAVQPVAQVEPPPPEPVAAEADPVAATPPPVVAAEPEPQPEPEPEPEPVVASAAPAIAQEPEPTPLPAPVVAASPKRGFGAIDGFTRARPVPAEQPEPAWASAAVPPPAPPPPPAGSSKVTSTGLLVRGFSAHTHQTVESTTAKDFLRPAVSTPTTPPAPLPPPQEKQLETTAASGADIYKPWA